MILAVCLALGVGSMSVCTQAELIEMESGGAMHVIAVEPMPEKAAEIVSEGSYVTSACIYMNPLSSYYPLGGDSGEIYHIKDDLFMINSRHGAYSESVTNIDWGWQAFPYTDEEWDEMCFRIGDKPDGISTMYDEMLYQPISDRYSLMQMDGELWFVETHADSSAGEYIWSIYTLVPEETMGIVQWEFTADDTDVTAAAPVGDSALSIAFDVECAEISAFATTGCLIGVEDEDEDTWQKGMNLTVPVDTPLYWSPITSGQQVYESELSFYLLDEKGCMTFGGNIYITSEEISEDSTLYMVQLACGDLAMEQDELTGGAVIRPSETQCAVDGESEDVLDYYTFYAELSEKFNDTTVLIKGLEVNSINYRSEFHITVDEETRTTWRGIEIDVEDLEPGDIVSVTFTGLIQETSPAVIMEPIKKLEYLGDRSMEK